MTSTARPRLPWPAVLFALALAGCATVREVPLSDVLDTRMDELTAPGGFPVKGWVRADGERFDIPVNVYKKGNTLVFGDEPVYATLRLQEVRGLLIRKFDAGKTAAETGKTILVGTGIVVGVAVGVAILLLAAFA
jgi:hypothetical protein